MWVRKQRMRTRYTPQTFDTGKGKFIISKRKRFVEFSGVPTGEDYERKTPKKNGENYS